MKNADFPFKLSDIEKSGSSPDHSLDDKVLWKSIRKGNNLAFTTLYKKYVNQLFNYGMHISFDRELVKDCLQELFSGVWLRREGLVELNHVNYYLFKAFRNLVIQKLNKKRKIIFGIDFSKNAKEFDPSWEENLISDQTKEQKLKQLKNAIACLTVRQREAVLLKYFNELLSSFMNGPEAFANFRRSGFPTLAANPFPGREVPFINRLTYPNSEISVNSDNVQAAIAAQGADNLATKVWWDK